MKTTLMRTLMKTEGDPQGAPQTGFTAVRLPSPTPSDAPGACGFASLGRCPHLQARVTGGTRRTAHAAAPCAFTTNLCTPSTAGPAVARLLHTGVAHTAGAGSTRATASCACEQTVAGSHVAPGCPGTAPRSARWARCLHTACVHKRRTQATGHRHA
eukprot:365087-Chlamydomonas_euryale.AAC.2